MKIDHDYLKSLLQLFEDSDKSVTTYIDLCDRGFVQDQDSDEENEKLVFHMEILADQNFISRTDDKDVQGEKRIGYLRSSGQGMWSVMPLRLTAQGHEFLEAIKNETVWKKLKKNFKDASIITLARIAPQLLNDTIQNQVKGLLD